MPTIIDKDDAPKQCDVCRRALTSKFYDCATTLGSSWGYLCGTCYVKYGRGLGPGLGQQYKQQADGSWLKIKG